MYCKPTSPFSNFRQFQLTNACFHGNICKAYENKLLYVATVAQSVERRIGSAEVTGPIPVSSLKTPDCSGVFCFIKII